MGPLHRHWDSGIHYGTLRKWLFYRDSDIDSGTLLITFGHSDIDIDIDIDIGTLTMTLTVVQSDWDSDSGILILTLTLTLTVGQ